MRKERKGKLEVRVEQVRKELKVIKEELVERGLKELKGKLEVLVEQVHKEHKEALDQEHKVHKERLVLVQLYFLF